MRLFVSVIATTAMFFVASVAGAATTFTATASSSGGPLSALNPGDVVTIDIQLTSDGEALYGLGGSAVGYDASVAVFSTGTTTASALNLVCLPAPTGCLGGLPNSTSNPLTESSLNAPGLPEVQFFNGISVAPITGTGLLDEGYSGVAGTAQFQLVFSAGAAGTTTINLGANGAYGDNAIGAGGTTLASTNGAITITVVPEPGTAILMGLGLVGLASAGRRN
jgi:hypothetical protein